MSSYYIKKHFKTVLGGLIEIPKEVFEEIKQLLKQDKLNFV